MDNLCSLLIIFDCFKHQLKFFLF